MKEGETYPYSLLGEVEDLQPLAMEMFRKIGEGTERHKQLWLQRQREQQEREDPVQTTLF